MSLSKTQLYIIDVLLATYNGEPYIREFVASLSSQVGVDINLYVSDDGSTDTTLNIIQEFQDNFLSLTILDGPRTGPANNFLSLLNNSKANYVAFADQDDVWLPNHLINSIQRLEKFSGIPAISFAQSLHFRETSAVMKVWPPTGSYKGVLSILFQNLSRGCTQVMNNHLRQILVQNPPSFFVMHDWWAALVAAIHGKVIFGENVEVAYRLHNNNFIGMNQKPFFSRVRDSIGKPWPPMLQLASLVATFSKTVKTEEFRVIQTWSQIPQMSFLTRFILLSSCKFEFRLTRYENMKLRLLFLFYPLLFSRN